MARLRISLLGTYAVHIDGEAMVDLGYDKIRALLAILAVERDHPQRRERLAGLLWPDVPESDARRSLRVALFRLRSAIGDRDADPACLLTTRYDLQLNPEADVWMDVGAFSSLMSTVDTHPHETVSDCPACLEKLARAVALYHGDLLPGFSLDSAEFEEWLVVQRERLHHQVLAALDHLAEAYLAQGNYDLALTYARQQIELEPWQERAHQQAMRALALSGQRAAALAQYDLCARTLHAEIGLTPDAATVTLMQQIRQGALVPVPAASASHLNGGDGDAPASEVAQLDAPPVVTVTDSRATETEPNVVAEPPDSLHVNGDLIEGERRVASLLLAEIVGADDVLANAGLEVWAETVHKLLSALGAQVARYGGTVVRSGDSALVAAFGAQEAHEDDAERAVLAGLAMMSDVGQGDATSAVDGLALKVGVTTGEAVVMVRPGDGRAVHAAILTEAAWVQRQVPPSTIWVSDATYRRVAPRFDWAWLGEVVGEGHTAVRLYRPLMPVAAPAEHDVGGLRAPLVGREAELRSVMEAIDRAGAGIGGIVTVVGEAGIGKSRLVTAVREGTREVERRKSELVEIQEDGPGPRARSASVRWVEGAWQSYNQGAAYSGWQMLIRRLLKLDDDCTEASCAAFDDRVTTLCPEGAERITPYVARLLALPVDDATAAQMDSLVAAGLLQEAIFRAVAELVSYAARDRPLVLVLEDIHWADAASLDLLTHLLPLTDIAPLLLLLVQRPEPDHGSWRVRETVARDYAHRHTDVRLGPLTSGDDARLVRELLAAGRRADDPDLVADITRRAEGNPFFTAELVQALFDRDGDSRERDLPVTVQGVLMARIDRLPLVARQVLQLASVMGRTFTDDLLADLMGKTRGEESVGEKNGALRAALLALTRARMIREQVETEPRDAMPTAGRAYAFEHELTLEAAYDSLLTRKRRILHRRVAEAFERLYPEQMAGRLGVLAHHWEQAGDVARAVDALRRAGEQAAAQYANDAAAGYLTRALRLAEGGDPQELFEILLADERIHLRQGAFQAQLEDLTRLRDLVELLDDARLRAIVALRWEQWAIKRGDRAEAIRYAETGARLAEEAGAPAVAAEAYLRWGGALNSDHRPEEAAVQGAKAVALAREAGSIQLEVESLYNLALEVGSMDDVGQANQLLEDALQRSIEIRDRYHEGRCLSAIAQFASQDGDLARAIDYSEAALRVFRETGYRSEEPWALSRLALLAGWQADYGSALAHSRAAIDAARDAGLLEVLSSSLIYNSQLRVAMGSYDTARLVLEEAAAFSPEVLSSFGVLWLTWVRAQLAFQTGNTMEAQSCGMEALKVLKGLKAPRPHHWFPLFEVGAHQVLGDCLAELGRYTEAEERYRRALAVDLRVVVPAAKMECRACLAEILVEEGEMDAARAEVETLLAFVATHPLDSPMQPLRIHLACYRVLGAVDDARANDILVAGHQELMRRARTIGDEGLRRSYLANVPVNQEIVAAYRAMSAADIPDLRTSGNT